MLTSISSHAKTLALAALCASSLVACVIDTAPHAHGHGGGYASGSTPGDPGGNSQASGTPMLAEVDTGKTMSATPGDGAGVFIEYSTGGHWRIWWTCDTNQTLETCRYTVKASATESSTIKNASFEGPQESATFDVTTTSVSASTTTTTALHGVRFDTDPGAVIQLETTLGGVADSSYVFFVQAGQVNGGFSNKLTNPILLQGSTP